ncbi:MAG: ComEA family DNA-binding protein [Candidatus Levybacteria bacterium]|nr:ComEA family DNA-binding protein [Candidatus Levybacteria bacterium]
MDAQELIAKYSPFIKRNLLILSLGALGMIFFTYGLIGLFLGNQSASEDIVFESSQEQDSQKDKTIFIDIEGAVVNPGLYKLSYDARIQDALVAAGGLSSEADREYIAKNINLATKLTDGGKIYIPIKGETESIKGIIGIKGGTADGAININTGSQTQLEELPGIGPVTAQKIISGRPYTSIDELLNKKIVGSKVYEQIKERISVY